MRQAFRWMTVVVLCCAATAAGGEEAPDARLQEAQAAFDEVKTRWDEGRYAEALARGEHALALREAVLGGSHPDVARCLVLLGSHYLLQGNPVRAEPLLQRALAIQEAALGKDHPEVAQTLTHLASLYPSAGFSGRAEQLHARALAIREAALGENHPLVAESLNHLAAIYLGQYSWARAELLLRRALAIQEAALGKHHPAVAQTLAGLAEVLWGKGLYARAEPLYVRALALSEAALGPSHPTLANLLWVLSEFYRDQGLSARAEPLSARALAIWEAALENNPPNLAGSLAWLAHRYMRRGAFARAEPIYERTLALQEAALGKSHPQVADTLYEFAVNYDLQGLYGRAEPLYERALAIREAAFGESHPQVAFALGKLGNLYMAQGLYARAEPLLLRSLAIRQAAFGEKNPDVALALASLGSLYMAQGLYARAEPLLLRSLSVWEAVTSKSHPYVAVPLGKLGRLYLAQGQYRRAAPLLQRALAISEASSGRNDPDVADALQDLADLFSAQGLYRQAQPLYERTLAIRATACGQNHARNAEALNQLAVGHLSQRRLATALPLLTRAFAISEQRLRQEALGFSDARLASFLQVLRTDEERLYALLRAHPGNARVRRLALAAALLLKGRSVEETAHISRVIYQSLSAQEHDTLERLRGLRTQRAMRSLQGPGGLPPAAYQRQLEELAEQADALEATLARSSAPLRALAALPSPAEIVDRVAAALPEDGALVEFITYEDRTLVPQRGAPEPQLRTLAVVLSPDSTIRALDLGPAGPINSAATSLRDALANKDAAYQPQAEALYRLAFQPLLPLLGKTRRLFLSPDGPLALVPFAALHDGQQFLVDTFDFTYLSSGRDLLSRPRESTPPGSVVVLADPDFGAVPQAPTSSLAGASTRARRSTALERYVSTLREGLSQRAWALTPLPGTRQEAEAIQRLLPHAQLFLGSEATKERLLGLPTPGILHLATHGFFLGDAAGATASRALGHTGELGEDPLAPSPVDPLLRSGLVLAGARAPARSGSSPAPPPADNALVTALELTSLNLWGTQLVVLSACDTGRGDVQLGQGVYGLRRAFLVAGAETLVMSLWKVNDETTHELMEAYYTNLLAGQGRASALREAMRAMRQVQTHPFYWAPFITVGKDTPLRLRAPSGSQ